MVATLRHNSRHDSNVKAQVESAKAYNTFNIFNLDIQSTGETMHHSVNLCGAKYEYLLEKILAQ